MPIGISDDHVELATRFGKWAGSLGGIEAARAAEDDPAAEFAEHGAAVAEMGLAGIAVPEDARRRRRLAARPRRGARGCGRGAGPGSAARHRRRLGGAAATSPARSAAGEMRVALALGADGIVLDAPGATHALVVRGDDVVLVPLAGVDLAPGVSPDLTRRTSRADLTTVEGTVVPGLEPDRLRAVARDPGRRRGLGRRALVPGHRGRLRRGARAVRPADRRLPGDQAPVRRDARDLRVGDRRRLGRRRARSTRRPSRRRSPPRSPGPCASTAPSRWRRTASRCSAGSASPSSTTPTSTCAVRSRCARCWAPPRDAAARLADLAGPTAYAAQLHIDLDAADDDAARRGAGTRSAHRRPARRRAAGRAGRERAT